MQRLIQYKNPERPNWKTYSTAYSVREVNELMDIVAHKYGRQGYETRVTP